MQLIKSILKTAALVTVAMALYAPVQSAPATFAPWRAELLKNTAPSFGNVHKDAMAYQRYAKMTNAQMLKRFNRIKGICTALRKDEYLAEIRDEEFANTGSKAKADWRLKMARHEAFAADGTICK
jgi:hypothetical protein